MKKIMALGLALLTMLIMFTGCGGKDTIQSLGLEALEVMDSFLDGNMNSSKAVEKNYAIRERYNKIERPEKDSPEWDEYFSISDEIIFCSYAMFEQNTLEEKLLHRNKLAEVLGKPLRDK